MATEYKLSYTADEIDSRLGRVVSISNDVDALQSDVGSLNDNVVAIQDNVGVLQSDIQKKVEKATLTAAEFDALNDSGDINNNTLYFVDGDDEEKIEIDSTLSIEGQAADAKAVGDAISAIPQSDWDVNDESNPAFIKNRPFYEETAELVYIPYESRTANQVENNIAMYTITDGISEGLKVGKEYKVIIDGLEYVDVAKAGENWNYLGNADALIDGSFTQESPFGVFAVDANMSMTGTPYAGIAFLTSDGSPTHSFGITTTETVAKTIDTKYLPEHLQFGETGNTTITTVLPYEEREFYYDAENIEGVAVYTDESFVPFEEGKVYHVTFDGVEYTCQSFCDVDNFGSMILLGSAELLMEGTAPDDLPFCSYSVTSDDGSEFTFAFKSTSGGMHSFGIEVEETEIVKIDKKYLPDDLNKPDVVIFDKGDLISSYENTAAYACTCTHTREELLEIYEKLNVNKNQENTPKIIARLITDNDGDVYSFINYSASQRTSGSVQFFFDYAVGGQNYSILAGYSEGSFHWTETGYDTESKLREKQNKTLIVTAKMGSSSDFWDGASSGNLTDISHTWQQIEDAIANNAEVKMKVGFTDSEEMFIFAMSDDLRNEGCIIFHTINAENLVMYAIITQDGSGQWYKEGFATVSQMLEKQDKITGTAGDFVVIGADGNVTTNSGIDASSITSGTFTTDRLPLSELAESVGGVKIVELWKNASPTSSFATQTISVDLSEYNHVLIVYNTYNSDTSYCSVIVGKEYSAGLLFPCGDETYRRLANISDDGITFGKVYLNQGSGSSYKFTNGGTNSQNVYCIPAAVYGIGG